MRNPKKIGNIWAVALDKKTESIGEFLVHRSFITIDVINNKKELADSRWFDLLADVEVDFSTQRLLVYTRKNIPPTFLIKTK